MGILKNQVLKRAAKRIGLGIVDSIPVVSTVKKNIESQEGGEGKVDWLRLSTTIIVAGLLVAFITGHLTMEELETLLNLID